MKAGRASVVRWALWALALALPGPTAAGSLYDATVDTVFDIITDQDSSAFACLLDRGRGARQMWDKRVDGEPEVDAFLFEALFSDGTGFEVAVNPEFGSAEAARAEALRVVEAAGRMLTLLRDGIAFLGLHDGTEGPHAGAGKVFLYAGRIEELLAFDHLEETLFHEAVHVWLDPSHATSDDWRAAQASDGAFLTAYAEAFPESEDLAETALFAFALLHHPGRIPPVDTADVATLVPARIAYVADLFPPGEPLIGAAEPPPACVAAS